MLLEALGIAVGIVFVAELGDKSQLLTLTLTARYRWRIVLTGISIATALLMAVSAALGAFVGDVVPDRPLELAAGVAFLAFAAWTMSGDDEDTSDVAPSRSRRSALTTTIGSFALAELGDKTMLTAFTLSSTNDPVGTWAGATIGMVAANAIALVVGDRVGARLSPRLLRVAVATTFALFGMTLILGIG